MTNPIDEATTKTAGALRAVKSRFRGLTGVFTTLAKQHGEVKHLLERATRTLEAMLARGYALSSARDVVAELVRTRYGS